jgi:hypothetical protein
MKTKHEILKEISEIGSKLTEGYGMFTNFALRSKREALQWVLK